jgi:dolichol-phosphate mannosyltransferase
MNKSEAAFERLFKPPGNFRVDPEWAELSDCQWATDSAKNLSSPLLTDVSIVIPVKNEVESIESLAREISETMNRRPWSWECIWVDDGSTDGSLAALERVAALDGNHGFISLESGVGQSAALWAGFGEARGLVLATLDGDGQNDPRDIPGLVELVLSGRTDMANGRRLKRRDNLVRKAASRLANAARNRLTGRVATDAGCSARAFRRECVASLIPTAGMHRFIPTLAALRGFRICEIPVNHRPRSGGKSKYSLNNRIWVGFLDLLGIYWLRKRAFRYKISGAGVLPP